MGAPVRLVIASVTGFVLSKVCDRIFSTCANNSGSKRLPATTRIVQAIHFSAQKHKTQKRKNSKQTPYICHPVGVAHRLAIDAGIDDEDVLIAALLHDTVEDTDTTLEEIERLFGSRVAEIVDEVSDDKTLPKHVRKQQQIDHAPHISHEAKLVKLADKLDNLTDLLTDTPIGWEPQRVTQYFDWAEKVIRGLRSTNEPLETAIDDVLANREMAIEAAQWANT